MATRPDLLKQAEAALELQRRYREEKILFYQPCSPKHLAFHTSRKPIRAIFGGNRSGKTMCGLMELLFHACFSKHPYTGVANPRAGHYRIFTTKFQIAEELIVPLLREYVPRRWLRGGVWESAYDPRYHILHGADGSIIDILTYDQENSVAESVSIDGAWMDEEAPEKMFSGTVARLISTRGFLLMTVTPLYGMSWALSIWRQAGTPTIDVFRLSIHDNKYLPQEFVAEMIEQWPESERAAREKGDFLEFAGLVYKELDDRVHFITNWKEPSYYTPVVMACDPHPRKPTVCVWAALTPGESLVVFDELEVRGTAKEIVRAIQEREKTHKFHTGIRLIDPAANKQISGIGSMLTTLGEFQNAGMDFTLADNNEVGYSIVHEYLAYNHEQEIGGLNRPRLYFTDKVPKTWLSMKELLWDEYRFASDLRDPKERVKDYHKDFPDCIRYICAQKPSVSQDMPEPIDLNVRVASE